MTYAEQQKSHEEQTLKCCTSAAMLNQQSHFGVLSSSSCLLPRSVIGCIYQGKIGSVVSGVTCRANSICVQSSISMGKPSLVADRVGCVLQRLQPLNWDVADQVLFFAPDHFEQKTLHVLTLACRPVVTKKRTIWVLLNWFKWVFVCFFHIVSLHWNNGRITWHADWDPVMLLSPGSEAHLSLKSHLPLASYTINQHMISAWSHVEKKQGHQKVICW